MRKRLLPIVALAVLAATTVAGAGVAQGPTTTTTTADGGVEITLPDGLKLPELTACTDGIDNDEDELIDTEDPGCENDADDNERENATEPDDETTVPDPALRPEQSFDKDESGGGKGEKKKGEGGKKKGDNGSGGTKAKGKGDGHDHGAAEKAKIRNDDGSPTNDNPSLSVTQFGPTPTKGIPSFIINQFEIPPFMLPIYQACGTQYGIPWPVLASIHKIESGFGTNMGPSTAGAIGQMQFLPSTWKAYGTDANDDGRKDPYNPLDAVCAAARYLRASGGESDIERAIFAYNHADWYVDEVLTVARQYGKLPDGLVGSLTGLTEGAHFPVAARARYADDISERKVSKDSKLRKRKGQAGLEGITAPTIEGSPSRRGINIYARDEAPVVAVNDGVVKQIGRSKKLGRYVVLQDSYGNRFTYAQLDSVADVYPVPRRHKLDADDFKLVTPGDHKPDGPASSKAAATDGGPDQGTESSEGGPGNTEDLRARLYAYPERPRNVDRADITGQLDALFQSRFPGYETVKAYLGGVLRLDRRNTVARPLEKGSEVVAGTVLGRIGKTDELAPHVNFSITPAGRGAKKIDPKPILDGWKLLEETAVYRAEGKDPFREADVSQVLLMSKPELERHVLADSRLSIYACGREDVKTHQIDARVLRTLSVLSARGFRLTITSLKCGHSYRTTSGNVSNHSSGNAVDIAQINGQPVLGNQGKGSITETLVRELLTMQEPNQCDELISLMDFGGPSFALADHNDHVHCGFTPRFGSTKAGKQFDSVLNPGQWERLLDRIGKIDQPEVSSDPSKYSLPAGKDKGRRSSRSHVGE